MNFFDTKNFSMRREIVKRLLETGPSKQTTSEEETNFLRLFYREGDKWNFGETTDLKTLDSR